MHKNQVQKEFHSKVDWAQCYWVKDWNLWPHRSFLNDSVTLSMSPGKSLTRDTAQGSFLSLASTAEPWEENPSPGAALGDPPEPGLLLVPLGTHRSRSVPLLQLCWVTHTPRGCPSQPGQHQHTPVLTGLLVLPHSWSLSIKDELWNTWEEDLVLFLLLNLFFFA